MISARPIQTLIQTLDVLLTPWKLECDWIGKESRGDAEFAEKFRIETFSVCTSCQYGRMKIFLREGEAPLFETYRGNFGYLKVGRLLVNRIPVFNANDGTGHVTTK